MEDNKEIKSRKLAAIVFTDIVDWTQKMSNDEELGLQYIRDYTHEIKSIITDYNGTLLKELGDGCLLIFDSAYNGYKFAEKLQYIINNKYEFQIRCGIHIGDILKEKNDYFGSGVNIASRVHQIARPGEICITQDVFSQIKSYKDVDLLDLGNKNLKGIDDPIHIYKAITEYSDNNEKDISFITELFLRRVPQFIGVYAAIGWTIIQFIDWIINRYQYSPHLVDLSFAITLSMIPSILILAYFHGAPGKDRWTKVEKIGIPVNILACIVINVILFYPKDLGAVTTIVTYEHECSSSCQAGCEKYGNVEERIIPKAEFRKNITIFNLNVDKHADYAWLSYAICEGLTDDLEQDIFMHVKSQNSYKFSLDKYKKDIFDVLPLSLQRELAADGYQEYFVNGYITSNQDVYELTTKLYKTKGLQLVSSQTFKAKDIFSLIDQASIKIRENVGVPEDHINETIDMPASEILTSSTKAFKNYVRGTWSLYTPEGGVNFLEAAVLEDKDFARAYVSLMFAYTYAGQGDKRLEAAEKAMNLSYKLAAKDRIFPKAYYYFDTQQRDKAIAYLKRHIELNPFDKMGYNLLSQFYQLEKDYLSSLKTLNQIVDIHKNNLKTNKDIADFLTEMGDIALYNLGDYELALDYYNEYLNIFPDEIKIYEEIANLYERMNDYKNAKKIYEKGIAIEPDNISLMQNLIYIDEDLGSVRLDELEKLLNKCKVMRDSLNVYFSISSLSREYGQINNSLRNHESALNILKKNFAPGQYIWAYIQIAKNHGLLGNFDKALNLVKEYEENWGYPMNMSAKEGHFEILLQNDKWFLLSKFKHEIEKLTEKVPYMSKNVILIDACIAEHLDNNYNLAIDLYNKYLETNKQYRYSQIDINIARCHRKMKNYRKALNTLDQLMQTGKRYKFDSNYEYALIYKNKGDYNKALEYIDIFLDHYSGADKKYIHLIKALKLKEELLKSI